MSNLAKLLPGRGEQPDLGMVLVRQLDSAVKLAKAELAEVKKEFELSKVELAAAKADIELLKIDVAKLKEPKP